MVTEDKAKTEEAVGYAADILKFHFMEKSLTRLVIVDHRTGAEGRIFDSFGKWAMDYQDDGRTLKIFLED